MKKACALISTFSICHLLFLLGMTRRLIFSSTDPLIQVSFLLLEEPHSPRHVLALVAGAAHPIRQHTLFIGLAGRGVAWPWLICAGLGHGIAMAALALRWLGKDPLTRLVGGLKGQVRTVTVLSRWTSHTGFLQSCCPGSAPASCSKRRVLN